MGWGWGGVCLTCDFSQLIIVCVIIINRMVKNEKASFIVCRLCGRKAIPVIGLRGGCGGGGGRAGGGGGGRCTETDQWVWLTACM